MSDRPDSVLLATLGLELAACEIYADSEDVAAPQASVVKYGPAWSGAAVGSRDGTLDRP